MYKNKSLFKKELSAREVNAMTFNGTTLNFSSFLDYLSPSHSKKIRSESLSHFFMRASQANIHYRLWQPHEAKVWALIHSHETALTGQSVCYIYHSLSNMGVLWHAIPDSINTVLTKSLVNSLDSLAGKETAHLFYALGNFRVHWLLIDRVLQDALLQIITRNISRYGAMQLACVFIGISKMRLRFDTLSSSLRTALSQHLLNCLKKTLPIDLAFELFSHITPLLLASNQPASIKSLLQDKIFHYIAILDRRDDPTFLVRGLQTLYKIGYRITFSAPSANDRILLKTIHNFAHQASSSTSARLLYTTSLLTTQSETFKDVAPSLYASLYDNTTHGVSKLNDEAMSEFLQFLQLLSKQDALDTKAISLLSLQLAIKPLLYTARPEHIKAILSSLACLSLLTPKEVFLCSESIINSLANVVYYLTPQESIPTLMACACLKIDWHNISPDTFHRLYSILTHRIHIMDVAPSDMVHLIVTIDTFGYTWESLDESSQSILATSLVSSMPSLTIQEILRLTSSLCHIAYPMARIDMLSPFAKLYQFYEELNESDLKLFFVLLSTVKYCYSHNKEHFIPNNIFFTHPSSDLNSGPVSQLQNTIHCCGYNTTVDYTFGIARCMYAPLFIPTLHTVVDVVDKNVLNCTKNITSAVRNRHHLIRSMGYYYMIIDLTKWQVWSEHEKFQYIDACLYLIKHAMTNTSERLTSCTNHSSTESDFVALHASSLFAPKAYSHDTKITTYSTYPA